MQFQFNIAHRKTWSVDTPALDVVRKWSKEGRGVIVPKFGEFSFPSRSYPSSLTFTARSLTSLIVKQTQWLGQLDTHALLTGCQKGVNIRSCPPAYIVV